MDDKKKRERIILSMLLILATITVIFVSTMGFLNYRSKAISLQDSIINRVETDLASSIDTSLVFGKSFDNYYGMDDNFAVFSERYPGPQPFVISKDGELMYYDGDEETADYLQSFLSSRDFVNGFNNLSDSENGVIKSGKTHVCLVPIHADNEVVGYFCSIYNEKIFASSLSSLTVPLMVVTFIVLAIVFLGIILFRRRTENEGWKERHQGALFEQMTKTVPILIIAGGVLLISALTLNIYQEDYRSKVYDSINISLRSLESQIDEVRVQGVDLREADGLREFILSRVESLEMLRSVRITEEISEVNRTRERSDIIKFAFGEDFKEKAMYLEAEVSDDAIDSMMREILLVLISTMVILLIFAYEMGNLVELFVSKIMKDDAAEEAEGSFSEKHVSLALRFTGFLCSTAEYMCVPYAAMLIRASGESLFGLSVGMTAALPLTLEGLAQMIAMLALPRYVRKFDIKKVLLASTVLMIVCNLSAFAIGGAAVIILCRALAGVAYSGFKQVSNYLITSGYETEKGRSENISQDNAGLLAGATCGAGLGAILSANTGYATTFLFSAVLFALYFAGTASLVPWKMIDLKAGRDIAASGGVAEEPVKIKTVMNMFKSPEIWRFILLMGIPLNIGVMLCVTLIPAICQGNGISSVMLSYCYIANGIAGIYIGPSLVSKAKAKFGTVPCIAVTFALTAFSIFILKVPPIVVMIIISSTILGFLDGFATPLVTDNFMDLKIVKQSVNESTALIFSVVLTYVLLTFAPMVAELLLLPGKGAFSPMMIGVAVYVVAAVALFLSGDKKRIKEK